ncbi:MAG: winged helix-turn-helix domain-containing protein [Candidatus Thermoplasmatota archaeon]|nr:winged helix-turn-helix domain-containing protein [Candidatus Thermoplasmatota archaeon]MDD5778275.1 winged helix-turn-helix domain-containing protein [Candidatus Thermoplasmatota archaeon]
MADVDSQSLEKEDLKILGTESRVKILKHLGKRKMTVSELSRQVDLSKSTVHEHLATLADAGFIEKSANNGNIWVYYHLTDKGKKALRSRTRFFLMLSSAIVVLLLGLARLWQYASKYLRDTHDALDEYASGGPEGTSLPVVAIVLLLVSLALFAVSWRSWKTWTEKARVVQASG